MTSQHSGPATVFLARHGETEWNVLGRRQGQLDSPLTALGRDQALSQGRLLVGEGVDLLLSSPLGRARETAEIMADVLGVGVEVLTDLRELDHGRYAGLTAADLVDRPDWAERRRDKYDWRFPDGESYRDVDQRARRLLDDVLHRPLRAPVLVSHEMIGRMLVKNLTGIPAAEALATHQEHGVMYRIDVRTRRLGTIGPAEPEPPQERAAVLSD
jgi:probable phosphoglycerate mutase